MSNKLKEQLQRMSNVSKNNTDWSKARDLSLYDIIDIEYPFGTRKALKRKENSLYEELQASRGNNFDIEKTEKETVDEIDAITSAPLSALDGQRLGEILSFSNMISLDSIKNFIEIGFRVPKFMKIFRDEFGKKVWGYDVVKLNVVLANKLGFHAFPYDLNDCDKSLTLGCNSLIFCYHVIEHVTDPLKALKRIYSDMGENCYLHVEIPVEEEREIPNYETAHMFAFKAGDLEKMLSLAGFKKVVHCSTHPDVERFLVTKKVKND